MATFKRRCFGLIFLLLFFLVFYYSITDIRLLLNFFNSYKHVYRWKKHRENVEICEGLYGIAKEMLNGSRIVLPFQSNHTRWNFYDGKLAGNFLTETSLEWKISNQTRDFIKLYNGTKSRDIKVKKHFITFANNCCELSKYKAVVCALYPGGFDTTRIHDFGSLSAGFKKTHGEILQHTRGSGYWLWKPYIILKTLVENMANGDLLMYQDAGAHIVRDAGPLLKLCQQAKHGILIFYLTLLEQHYTKRDAFILMEMDNTHVYQTFQRMSSFVLFQKNCNSLQFVMEWLAYASNPCLITDMENMFGKQNLPGFREHRHDQSILSLLSKKWGLLAYRTPSQYGNLLGYMHGPYGQIIMHDRNRN